MEARRQWRRWLWLGAGAYGLGVAAWVVYSRTSSSPASPLSDDERLERFRRLASEYDRRIDTGEKRMGLDAYRAEVVGQAQGRVLEVGAGTCRNLAHYGAGVTSLVLADAAAEMVQQCREKLRGMEQARIRSQRRPEDVQAVVAVAEALPFGSGEFDSVVDTFSLCSVADADVALREMGRVLKRSPSSRLLLLEHGLSPYWPVNAYLNSLAAWHARSWGCWWNRPLQQLIERADLEILEFKRAHFGTTLIVVARPRISSSSPSDSPPSSLPLPPDPA